MDDFGLFRAIKGLVILLAIIAAPVVIIGLGLQGIRQNPPAIT